MIEMTPPPGLPENQTKKNGLLRTEKIITDPSAVPVLFHEKKQQILQLIIEKEMNIIDLNHATQMNPGTIKRHLNDLVEKGLVEQSRVETNIYSIKMKFYRATAKQFIVNLKWPD